MRCGHGKRNRNNQMRRKVAGLAPPPWGSATRAWASKRGASSESSLSLSHLLRTTPNGSKPIGLSGLGVFAAREQEDLLAERGDEGVCRGGVRGRVGVGGDDGAGATGGVGHGLMEGGQAAARPKAATPPATTSPRGPTEQWSRGIARHRFALRRCANTTTARLGD